ncbi:MAG: ATP-binding protein [Thermodesulfovibrionales bacterium]
MRFEPCQKHSGALGALLLPGALPFREKLQKMVDSLAEECRIAKCSFMIVNHDDRTLEVMAATNPAIIGCKRKLSDVSPSTRALTDNAPFRADKKRRAHCAPLERSSYATEFSLSVPLRYLDRRLGVVNFADPEDGQPFARERERLLVRLVGGLCPYLYAAQEHETCRLQLQRLEEKSGRLLRLDELKTNLTHFIVHDLKGPLSTIIANLDMLNSEPLTPQQFEYLSIAIEDSGKMQRMVMNILDVLRLEESKIEVFREETDIRRLAEREISSLGNAAARKRVQIALEGAPPRCFLDENLVGRTLSNLLLNAIEHSPEGSRISVAVRYDAGKRETVVAVADQGAGIPDALKEKVFDKFFQVQEEGLRQRKATTGLGLAFCKLVVAAHGGGIRVEDSEEGGARFVFTLPDFFQP